MSWGPAVLATGAALALLNVGAALLIVSAIGAATFAPWWVGVGAIVVGAIAAVAAWRLWRQYLASPREF